MGGLSTHQKEKTWGWTQPKPPFPFDFGPSPGQTGVQGQDNLFQFGKNTLWLIQELWPQPVTTTRSAWRDWERDGQHSDPHQNEGAEAGGKRREMMVGKLHPNQRWSERGRALGRGGGQVRGEQPLHPSCDKALAPHADGPRGPQAASWSTAWGKGRNS